MFPSRRKTLVVSTGAFLLILGATVMAGWFARSVTLTQVASDFAPMQFNTALCFAALGAAFLFSLRSSRIVLVCAAGVAVVAALTLLQYVFGWDLHIDRAVVEPFTYVRSPAPGRMSPHTGICFLLVAAVLFCLHTKRPARKTATAGSVVLTAFALAALLGYLLDLQSVFGFHGLNLMAVHTAFGFVVCGMALLVQALWAVAEKGSESAGTNVQRWVAAGFAIAVLVLLGISLASVRSIERFREMADLQNRTLRIQIGVEELFNDAMRVQRGQRGFTLTGDEGNLAAYEASKEKIRTGLEVVRSLALHPEVQAQLEDVRSAADDFLTHQEEVVRKRRAGPVAHDEQMAQRAEGLRRVDEIYRQIQEIHRLQDQLFEERTAGAEMSNRATLQTIYLGSFLAVMIVAAAMIRMRRDLRARLRAEHRLAAEQRLLASVIENTGDGLAVADATGQLVLMNPAGERILGRGVTDRPAEEWSDHYGLLLPDGSAPFPIERIPMTCALRGESVDDVDLLSRRPDGHEVLVRVTARPLLDAAGVPRGGVTTFRDVTELKRAEEEKRSAAQAMAVQAAEVARANLKLASLNQELVAVNGELEAFSYSVSHDLRAPLRHMAGYAQVLDEDFGEHIPPDGRRYLEKIQYGAVQMGRLIDALLNLGQIGRRGISLEQVDLGLLVREVQELLERDLGQRRVDWRIEALPVAQGDSSLLRQVFVNLLTNALKYSRTRAVTSIEVGQLAANGTRAFFVRDNGVGFDMKFVPKLFGVFQRLHRADEFEGTGVGLATVQRIITKHGGHIWAESAPDHGATFYFTLATPRAASTEETEAIAPLNRRN